MKKFFTLLLFLLILLPVWAQSVIQRAYLDAAGNPQVETLKAKLYNSESQTDSNLNSPEKILEFSAEAFVVASYNRGAVLADLDKDGAQEIIFGSNDTLYALKGNGALHFKTKLDGPILRPPAIGEVTGEGNLQLAVNYGHTHPFSNGGGVTLLDQDGNEMPGWPAVFENRMMPNSPALSDLDGDGQLEIVTADFVSGDVSNIYVLKSDGTLFNENWPVEIEKVAAFTPSVGDINNDGSKEIVIAGSSSGMYAINTEGEFLPGFPVIHEGVNYSYQSPILADITGDGNLEIIGSNHGDHSAFYAMDSEGEYVDGWPIPLPSWTYSPPTVTDLNDDGTYQIFMGSPLAGQDTAPVIYGFNKDGDNLDGFPIAKQGGNEGVITVADIDGDGTPELIFGSNITQDGNGFIHAYSLDGSGELEGFPLRPKGFTFMNGAVVGDVTGNGEMELISTSYVQGDQGIESTIITVYALGIPYDPAAVISNGYKGGNTLDGVFDNQEMGLEDFTSNAVKVYPNPSDGLVRISLEKAASNFSMNVFDLTGKMVFQINRSKNTNEHEIDLEKLTSGMYIIHIQADDQQSTLKWIKK